MAAKQRVSRVGTILTVEYPTLGKKFVVDVSKYSPEMRAIAEMHGWGQKFGDAKSGKDAAEKFAEVNAIHQALLQNVWERTAHPDLTPVICEAVSRIKKIPLEKIKKAAEKKPEQVKEWGSNAEVKAEIAKIRAEKAKAVAAEVKEELKVDLS